MSARLELALDLTLDRLPIELEELAALALELTDCSCRTWEQEAAEM